MSNSFTLGHFYKVMINTNTSSDFKEVPSTIKWGQIVLESTNSNRFYFLSRRIQTTGLFIKSSQTLTKTAKPTATDTSTWTSARRATLLTGLTLRKLCQSVELYAKLAANLQSTEYVSQGSRLSSLSTVKGTGILLFYFFPSCNEVKSTKILKQKQF